MALAQRTCTTSCSAAAGSKRSSIAAPAPRTRAVRCRQLPGSAAAAVCSSSSSSTGRVAVVARAASADAQRWTQQVKDGTVTNVSASAAAEMMQQGWALLDVRPPGESGKVGVKGAVAVPLYVEDPSNSISSLMKKAATIGTGGWWLGGTHMIPNTDFMAQVQAAIPKDKGVIVACQKGLRSLAAAEQLSRAGYSKVAWVNGGFDTAKPGDLETTNGKDIRYAGIGGLSEALGWTEVQQEENRGQFMGGVENIFKLVALVLAADVALFAYEQVMYMTGNTPQ